MLTFAGAGVAGGSLADGFYDLLVRPALVRDAAGQAAVGGDQTYTVHRLFGDVDGGDGRQFRARFGTGL